MIRRIRTISYHLAAILVSSVSVIAMIWVISASLRQPGLPPPPVIEWIPNPISWSNYQRAFELIPLGQYLLNSLLVIGMAIPLTLVTASWAGFAMAQFTQGTQNRLILLAIILLMIPVTSLWLARFVLFTRLGWIDTIWAIIAPAMMGSSPLFILLFYWTFRRIPKELYESAVLDGAMAIQIWRVIAMPLAKPTIVTVMVLTFILYWSDFISPLLYIKSTEKYTLSVGLQMLQQLDRSNWPLLMAASVVMITPIVLLFGLIQRYFWSEKGIFNNL
jgi:multiple sugar transport system permease protein